jgi:hypothetical protein
MSLTTYTLDAAKLKVKNAISTVANVLSVK